jgi:hypothetical protein
LQNIEIRRQLDDLVTQNKKDKTPLQLSKKADVAKELPEILNQIIAKGASKSIM